MPTRPSQSVKSGEDNKLLLYRIEQVEKKIDGVSNKLDNREDLKKADIIDLRDTIITRIIEVRDNLQDQIDELKKNKADKSAVNDVKTLIKAFSSAIISIITGLVIFYLTRA